MSAKIDQLRAQFDATAKEVGDKAAEVLSGTGLSLFVTFILGFIASGIAGRVAAHVNAERPLTAEEVYTTSAPQHTTMFANQRGSAMPYLFGWLLGVPATILFLIFALRAVF